jgi:hypothetical protein
VISAMSRFRLRPAFGAFVFGIFVLLTSSNGDLSPSAGPKGCDAPHPFGNPGAFFGLSAPANDPGAAANWPAHAVSAGCGRGGSFACSRGTRRRRWACGTG